MPVPKCGAALGCIAQATRSARAVGIRSAMRSGMWRVMWAIPTGGYTTFMPFPYWPAAMQMNRAEPGV